METLPLLPMAQAAKSMVILRMVLTSRLIEWSFNGFLAMSNEGQSNAACTIADPSVMEHLATKPRKLSPKCRPDLPFRFFDFRPGRLLGAALAKYGDWSWRVFPVSNRMLVVRYPLKRRPILPAPTFNSGNSSGSQRTSSITGVRNVSTIEKHSFFNCSQNLLTFR